jgi:phage-related holin
MAMEEFRDLLIVLGVVFVLYICVLFFVIVDLISGVKKAKERGELRTSTGYKRTVDKLARYYTSLICLTVMDVAQMMFVWLLDTHYGYNIPLLPIVTGFGAIGLMAIEYKSIREKADEKSQKNTREIVKLVTEILKHTDSPSGIVEAVNNYMEGDKKHEG